MTRHETAREACEALNASDPMIGVQFDVNGEWHDFIVSAPGLRSAVISARRMAPEGARYVGAFYVR